MVKTPGSEQLQGRLIRDLLGWETGLQFVGEVGNHNNDGVGWGVISRDLVICFF